VILWTDEDLEDFRGECQTALACDLQLSLDPHDGLGLLGLIEQERAKVASLRVTLAEAVIPLEALRLDGLHRPWLAPSIREAIERATDRAREVLKREV
jgi:hypothetical protein